MTRQLNNYTYLCSDIAKLALHFDVDVFADDIISIAPQSGYQKTLAIMALTHGDEVVGLAVIEKLLRDLLDNKFSLTARLLIIIANRKAYVAQRRYIDCDLNRCYGEQYRELNHETARVATIKLALAEADCLIDMHQTMYTTNSAFFISPHARKSVDFSEFLADGLPIVIHQSTQAITTSTTYMTSLDKPAATIELGDMGVTTEQMVLADKIIARALAWLSDEHKHKDVSQSRNQFIIQHHEKYLGGDIQLAEAIVNFASVEAGDCIASCDGKPLRTPVAGKVLLYPPFWFLDNYHRPDGVFAIAVNQDCHII